LTISLPCSIITFNVITYNVITGDYLMELSDLGRFSDPALLILASLAGGEKHGYAMMEDIEVMAAVRLGAGTLYGALSRLEQAGLIEALPAVDRRRPYRLTALGASSLRQALASMDKFVSLGRERLIA
jgi:DNA-binding PadR family transcriptional regulator